MPIKLTFLGTGTSVGVPQIGCTCPVCLSKDPRDKRKRSGVYIQAGKVAFLIDTPPEFRIACLEYGITRVDALVFTHAHMDHFYSEDLFLREGYYAHDMIAPTLKVFCPKTVYESFDNFPKNVDITMLEAYKTVEIGAYKITPLPAKHMFGSEAFIYIIQEEKTLLYAHDTGYFYDEVFDYIENQKIAFDMVSLDCTNVDIPISDEGSHMGFPNIERVLHRLHAIGAIKESTVKYVNHFSHNGNPIHEILEKRAKEYDCFVSYDGCHVTF
jgi:phosphoribosyl 1,2-cyclic phosphate phosphodiesterase